MFSNIQTSLSLSSENISDKDETSAFFKPGFDPKKGSIEDEDLTVSGLWVRELIRGAEPSYIDAPSATVEKGFR